MIVNFILENRYYDSVCLMQVASKLKEEDGIKEAAAMMGTDANKKLMEEIGLLGDKGKAAGPNDLIIAIDVPDEAAVEAVIGKAKEFLEERKADAGLDVEVVPHSLDAALEREPEANMVVISVPGQYARREAGKALNRGLHVMLFSDNVSVEDEILLKKLALEKDLLMMGPDCGTAIVNGVALGFANVVGRGPIGIAGASGTGIQEVSSIIARQGLGITQAIGTGGRDLKEKVGGLMMEKALRDLDADPDTELIVLVSKPPAEAVVKKLMEIIKGCCKKVIVCFLGGDMELLKREGISATDTLEEAALMAVSVIKEEKYEKSDFTCSLSDAGKMAEAEYSRLGEGQKYIRGIFSGGTLCDEARLVLKGMVGDIYSNLAKEDRLKLEDVWKSRENCLVDMGDDEFTRGVPHPMIDSTMRNKRIVQEAEDAGVGIIFLDVVLGYGAHPDIAGALLPAIEEAGKVAEAAGRYISFVASICGTPGDPQDYNEQKRKLEAAGVVLMETNAQAARIAAAIITRGKTLEK